MSLANVTSLLAVVLDWPALAIIDNIETMAAARLHRMQIFGSVMPAIFSKDVTYSKLHRINCRGAL